jgi:hypothetical protein
VTAATLREAARALTGIPGRPPAHGEMAQIRWQTRYPQVQQAPPLELSHPGQRLIRGSDPLAQDIGRMIVAYGRGDGCPLTNDLAY